MTDSNSDKPAESSNQEPDLSNSRLGEFLLLRRLGSGGMAEVYLADQTSLNRLVAVKVLKPSALSASNGIVLRRFEQEARTAGGLNHPNIVQIITTGRDGGLSYIVQEYVSGLNLAQWIRKHGSPDYRTGLEWMQQIASALRTASEAGIVHRDVKPENIMITRHGVAKVTDFGLAQLTVSTVQKMNLTQAGTTMGTPWYMSPEQIQGTKLDHRSDQYSFGVTCFYLFAGRPPFPGKNAVSVAVQHLKEEPPALCSLRADLPRQLCDVIHRMMAKDARDRFQTEADLEAALRKLRNLAPNTKLWRGSRWVAQVRQLMPSWRLMIPSLVLAAAAGFLKAQQLYTPIQLPPMSEDQGVVIESSAARQFAWALLNPYNRDAWKAVIDRWPETREAEVAQARLALHYVASPIPSYNTALDEFEKLVVQGEAPEKQHLKVIGRIGQAYALNQQVMEERAKGKPESDLASIQDMAETMLTAAYDVYTGPGRDIDMEYAISQAPQELRDFMRSSLRPGSLRLLPPRNP